MALKVDSVIMRELLESPGVRENYAQMEPAMQDWFRELLVSQGIYAAFVLEKQKAALAAMGEQVKAAVGSGKRRRHGGRL